MCSGRTKLLISHSHCSKPWARKTQGCLCVSVRVCVCVCASIQVFKLQFWLQQGLSLNQKSYKEVCNLAWLLCSAVVGAITHTYTQSGGGNVIKESDACEAQQPQAQNWFMEWERKRSRREEKNKTKRKQVRFRVLEAQRRRYTEGRR